MNLREQFKKETGLIPIWSIDGDNVALMEYTEWLEEKLTPKGLEERKEKFGDLVRENRLNYPKEMLVKFYDYWTEHGPKDRKMKFEKKGSFDVKKRLVTWNNNEKDRKVKHESFQERDDRKLREGFQRTEQLRSLPPFPIQGGDSKAVDKQKPLDWGNIITGEM